MTIVKEFVFNLILLTLALLSFLIAQVFVKMRFQIKLN